MNQHRCLLPNSPERILLPLSFAALVTVFILIVLTTAGSPRAQAAAIFASTALLETRFFASPLLSLRDASHDALPAGVPAEWWKAVQAKQRNGALSHTTNAVALLESTPVFTLTGEADSEFGGSVATAGDVNGDGFADLIVGARGYNTFQGRAYVYLGSISGPSITPAFTFTGEDTGDSFGTSVATAGDVNGDGFADVIIGGQFYDGDRGRAYLYTGGASGLSPTPAVTLTGEAGSYFGFSVANAGDVNGDGFADVIVSALYSSVDQGRVYLFVGGAGGLTASPALTLTGEAASRFGISVTTAGDVNGDGYDDVVVGANIYNGFQGRAYLFLGSAIGLTTTAALTLDGEASSSFGYSVATAGDINSDDFADVIIGAPFFNGYQGRAYVFFGGVDGLGPIAGITLTGEMLRAFGSSVASAGDVNDDGFADVIIGASGYNSSYSRVYLYLGSASGLSFTPARTLTGETPISGIGSSVATAGDVNGDGFADMIVGSFHYNSLQGRAYVYLGATTMPPRLFLPLVRR